MAYGADQTMTIRVKEAGVTTTTKKFNGMTRSIQQTQKQGNKTITTMTHFGQQTKKTGGLVGNFTGSVKSAGMQLIGMYAGVQLIQRGMQVLQEWVKKSIQEFRSFEKEMAEVSTILTGTTITNVTELQAGMESLSKSFGKSVHDLSTGMYDILSAAVPVEESLNMLHIATKGATAGLTDVATSVDVFTSILNAYGKTVAQMQSISDQLFQTVVRGKLRFEDLASSMGYIVPIAANLGVEFKEVAAALSTVTRQGQHVDMATRGLALGIQNIADITPKAAEAAERYGVDLSAVGLQVGGLRYVIEQLNRAMEEHGAKVLPEMISNMRSLRVFMALAGDEGVQGFITDLELLEESTGRTEEAMAKMMNTSQKHVEMLDQAMQDLNRSIGEAWSGIDIWWKKTTLWWGTLLSGGDADKAVSDYEKRVSDIRSAFLNQINLTDKLENRGTFENVMLNTESFKEVEKAIPITELKKYFNLEKQISSKAEKAYGLDIQVEKLKQVKDELKSLGSDATENLLSEMSKLYNKASRLAKKYGAYDGDGTFGLSELDTAISTLDSRANNITSTIETLKEKQLSNADATNYLKSGFDDLAEKIDQAQLNITELKYSLTELRREVEDTYTTMTGKTFEGILGHKQGVMALDMVTSRFQKFADMGIKYGDSLQPLKDSFSSLNTEIDKFNKEERMSWFKNMVESLNPNNIPEGKNIMDVFHEQMKMKPEKVEHINWFEKDIWKQVTIGTSMAGKSIETLIKKLHKYSNSQNSATKELKKFNEAIEEERLEISKNNLEIMNLQLKEMSKRHGLGRRDQRKMKELRIDNLEHNIEIQKEQIKAEETGLQERVASANNKYNSLKAIYDEYVDRIELKSFTLQDVRNTDYLNLASTINAKQKKIVTYSGMLKTETENWVDYYDTYLKNMKSLSEDPRYSGIMRDIWGLDEVSELLTKINTIEKKAKNISSSLDIDIPLGFGSWNIGSRQRGQYYIPKTGLYNLHKGEQVRPASNSNKTTGGTVNLHVDPISVNAVLKHNDDVEEIGSKIGQAIAAEFISNVNSNYEVG